MYYEEADGNAVGVINDYDMAIATDRAGEPSSKHRTGTKPFMAKALHRPRPPVQGYRHDLESLLYCFYFISLADVNSQDRKTKESGYRNFLLNWYTMSNEELLSAKSVFWEGPLRGLPPWIEYRGMYDWANNFRNLFIQGFVKEQLMAEGAKVHEIETYGNVMTFDEVAKCFDLIPKHMKNRLEVSPPQP